MRLSLYTPKRMKKKSNTRRNFIKNLSLASLSIGFLSKTSKASVLSTKHSLGDCEQTTLDYYGEGPFYTANPPSIKDNKLAKESEKGTKIRITGRVKNLDCTEFIPNTTIDVWHADDAGVYDNSGYNLRGKTTSNAQGFYVFETIKPGKYLNGSKYRPSHIHFKITPPNAASITTQLYFKGDSDIPDDAAASQSSGQYDATSRIIDLVENSSGVFEGNWDIIVDAKGVLGLHETHIDKGMIYDASPNPFTDKVAIKFGVFHAANIGLVIYDSLGKTIHTIQNTPMSKGKFEVSWSPNSDIAKGIYFIALKVNDMQVHYLKILRK